MTHTTKTRDHLRHFLVYLQAKAISATDPLERKRLHLECVRIADGGAA